MLFDFLIFLKLSYYNKFLPNIHLEVKDHHQEVQHAADQSLCHPICICFEISLELFQHDQKWNTQTVTNSSFFSDRLHVTFNLYPYFYFKTTVRKKTILMICVQLVNVYL